MLPRYRIVHFAPDPLLEARVPIAAVVSTGDGWAVVRMPHIPGPECLGGREYSAVVQLALEIISASQSIEEIQAAAGPHVTLSVERSIPVEAVDPVRWVEMLVGGAQSTIESPQQHQSPRRGVYGLQFFQNYRVDGYVQSRFRPGEGVDEFLSQARSIGAVTHYVLGARDVLLMEPILPGREQWLSDVSSVHQLFAAYQHYIPTDRRKNAKLVAYVLAGGRQRDRDRVFDDLSGIAHEVVDTVAPIERGKFIQQIKDVAATAGSTFLN